MLALACTPVWFWSFGDRWDRMLSSFRIGEYPVWSSALAPGIAKPGVVFGEEVLITKMMSSVNGKRWGLTER